MHAIWVVSDKLPVYMHVYVIEPSPDFTRIGQKERSGHNHEITHPTADAAQCSFA